MDSMESFCLAFWLREFKFNCSALSCGCLFLAVSACVYFGFAQSQLAM